MADYNQHEVKEEYKKAVEELARHGVPQEIIADSIGVSIETMVKYYGDIWKAGRAKAISGAAKKLYQKVDEGDNASLFFYLKTQGGYKETAVQENRYVNKDGEDLHKQDKEILENVGITTD